MRRSHLPELVTALVEQLVLHRELHGLRPYIVSRKRFTPLERRLLGDIRATGSSCPDMVCVPLASLSRRHMQPHLPSAAPRQPTRSTIPRLLRIEEDAVRRMLEHVRDSDIRDPYVRISARSTAPIEAKYTLEVISRSSVGCDEHVLAIDALKLAVDPESSELLQGVVISYRKGMWFDGFHFENPRPLLMMADPISSEVARWLSSAVGPILGSHGGSVTLADVREGVVYIRMHGGCHGCGLAPTTVNSVIRSGLLTQFPGITDVIDITRHSLPES